MEEEIKKIYETKNMFRLNEKNAPYAVEIIKVLEGLTTNSANQILKEVAYILPIISKLSF